MSRITIETPSNTRTWEVMDGDQVLSHIAGLLGTPATEKARWRGLTARDIQEDLRHQMQGERRS
jgi:hypothetical protein